MRERVLQYSKFIIKTLFRGVTLRDTSGIVYEDNMYQFNKVVLNDDLIEKIVIEGALYGFSREQCIEEIRLADEKIITNPSIVTVLNSVDLKELKIGTRLDLTFHDENWGKAVIKTIVDDECGLFVLDSQLQNVNYHYILYPLSSRLVPGLETYFTIWFSGKQITSNRYVYSPGVLKHMEIHTPSLVHTILDSDKNFSFNEERNDMQKTYYVNFPTIMDGQLCWHDSDIVRQVRSDTVSNYPLKITVIGGDKAEFIVNPEFKLHNQKGIRTYEINQLKICCNIKGELIKGLPLESESVGELSHTDDRWRINVKPTVFQKDSKLHT